MGEHAIKIGKKENKGNMQSKRRKEVTCRPSSTTPRVPILIPMSSEEEAEDTELVDAECSDMLRKSLKSRRERIYCPI